MEEASGWTEDVMGEPCPSTSASAEGQVGSGVALDIKQSSTSAEGVAQAATGSIGGDGSQHSFI